MNENDETKQGWTSSEMGVQLSKAMGFAFDTKSLRLKNPSIDDSWCKLIAGEYFNGALSILKLMVQTVTATNFNADTQLIQGTLEQNLLLIRFAANDFSKSQVIEKLLRGEENPLASQAIELHFDTFKTNLSRPDKSGRTMNRALRFSFDFLRFLDQSITDENFPENWRKFAYMLRSVGTMARPWMSEQPVRMLVLNEVILVLLMGQLVSEDVLKTLNRWKSVDGYQTNNKWKAVGADHFTHVLDTLESLTNEVASKVCNISVITEASKYIKSRSRLKFDLFTYLLNTMKLNGVETGITDPSANAR